MNLERREIQIGRFATMAAILFDRRGEEVCQVQDNLILRIARELEFVCSAIDIAQLVKHTSQPQSGFKVIRSNRQRVAKKIGSSVESRAHIATAGHELAITERGRTPR